MITWYGRCVRAEEQVEEYVSVSSAVTTKGKKKEITLPLAFLIGPKEIGVLRERDRGTDHK